MLLPYLNSASYNAMMRGGFVKNDSQQSLQQNSLLDKVKSGNQIAEKLTNDSTIASNFSVLQPEYQVNAPITKPKSTVKSFLELSKNEKVTESEENSESNSLQSYLAESEELVNRNSLNELGRGFFIVDPRLNSSRNEYNNEVKFNERLLQAFDQTKRKKPGSLVDLKF